MVNYQRLYAFLAGQIDDSIQDICKNLVNGQHGFHELNEVGIKLRNALLTAENMYLEEADDSQTE